MSDRDGKGSRSSSSTPTRAHRPEPLGSPNREDVDDAPTIRHGKRMNGVTGIEASFVNPKKLHVVFHGLNVTKWRCLVATCRVICMQLALHALN
jgi:hypothetical protein